MRITHRIDFIFTLLVIVAGSINIVVVDMPPIFNTIQLLFILVQAARIGYTMDSNKLTGEQQ